MYLGHKKKWCASNTPMPCTAIYECISDSLVSKRRQIQKNPFHFSVLGECNAFIYHYIYWVGQIYKIQNSQIYLLIEVEHLWWWGDWMMKIPKSVLSDGYTGYTSLKTHQTVYFVYLRYRHFQSFGNFSLEIF